jgi:hypothetical protein
VEGEAPLKKKQIGEGKTQHWSANGKQGAGGYCSAHASSWEVKRMTQASPNKLPNRWKEIFELVFIFGRCAAPSITLSTSYIYNSL